MIKDVLIYEVKDQIAYIAIDNPENNRLDPLVMQSFRRSMGIYNSEKS